MPKMFMSQFEATSNFSNNTMSIMWFLLCAKFYTSENNVSTSQISDKFGKFVVFCLQKQNGCRIEVQI